MRHETGPVKASKQKSRRRRIGFGLTTGLLLGAAIVAMSGQSGQAAAYSTVNDGVVAQISYAPNSYIIGNAYPGWTDVIQGPAQFSSGPGNPEGEYYRWGFLVGPNFSFCAWIEDNKKTTGAATTNRCGSPQQIDTPYFKATFTNGTISPLAGDASPTTSTGVAGCDTGYGNIEPWRVPSTPGSARSVNQADKDAFLWRYVSKDGQYVMGRNPLTPLGQGLPNWYFMPRGCFVLN